MSLPLDLGPILRAIDGAAKTQDIEQLSALAGLFSTFYDTVRRHLAMTLCGSVTSPKESGKLLSVQQASELTGLRPSFFYRNAHTMSCARRPSPGRLMFLESELINWAAQRGRLQ
jgi:hypothetical protein